MSVRDLEEGVDMVFCSEGESSSDFMIWHIQQLWEEAKNEPSIKPVKWYDKIYLMKPDEEETDISAKYADSFAKKCAVLEAYSIFLQEQGLDIPFDNENMELLESTFRKDYKDESFKERFVYDSQVLENFQKLLLKYRNILGLIGYLKD